MHRPHPRDSADRCALRAEVRGDVMLGTAFPAARILLVEQPGAWGRAGLRESDFDATLAGVLERRAASVGVRVVAIRQPGRTAAAAMRRWALADCRPGHEGLRWGRFARDDDLLRVPLDGSAGLPDHGPLYLVCAHGKHDVCCALRGRPVAAAIAGLRPHRVWECSHLGGDRFAANVLVLPAGLLYGRVPAGRAPDLVASADADEVLVDLLRGQVGLASTAQAALAFGYESLRLRQRGALRVRSASPIVAGRSIVRLDAPDGPHDVQVLVETVSATGLTCANPQPSRFLAYRPGWGDA